MRLLASNDDYCVLKIRIASSVTNSDISVETGFADEDLTKLDDSAKSMLLETPTGYVTLQIPILRYIAELSPSFQLLGADQQEESIVEYWLNFSWKEIGNTIR